MPAKPLTTQRRLLIAAPSDAARVMADALAPLGLESRMAETYDDAVTAFNELHPDVVLVEYRFDALRPYRLIYWLTDRRKQGEPFSIILARVLPLHLFQVDESDIEKTYLAIGADRVFSLEAESQSSGVEEALGRLRNMVARCLPAA